MKMARELQRRKKYQQEEVVAVSEAAEHTKQRLTSLAFVF
jgi:hypothetical protein